MENFSPWHSLNELETLERLDADPASGLHTGTASQRLAEYGPNRLVEADKRSIVMMLLSQFSDFMILILLLAAVISGILGEWLDTLAIMVIVLLNAIIGLIQEYRAERALDALKKLSEPVVTVIRDGAPGKLPAEELVPGDLVLLEAGDLVPADIRLLETAGLEIDESALTGESTPVYKQAQAILDKEATLGDRTNMAFRGTLATYGRAKGVVAATGMETQIGHIATLLQSGEHPLTPLQQRLSRFGHHLALIVLAVCAVVFVFGLLRGEDPLLMFLTAVSLAVAAIPEALPAVVTISLAIGASRMVKQQALIRQLPAVETLGSVTVICSDKTGTLTQNRMNLEFFVVNGEVHQLDYPSRTAMFERFFEGLALNNDAQFSQHGRILGEPTEVALLEAVARYGADPKALRANYPRVEEVPFDANRKMMTTVQDYGNILRAYTKGAPESVVAHCDTQFHDNELEPINRPLILQIAEDLASDGYRVLALASKDWQQLPTPRNSESMEDGLSFIGLMALMDPPRPEAKQAVATCRDAGIQPVMITGDHPVTAKAIAHRLGIIGPEAQVISGTDLDAMSDHQLQDAVANNPVYARVSPEHKIRIVEALQQQGEYVAMTGDGVNDAPALRRANIGIAMGKGGTDVAREASHMVLLDDNFATIVSAVAEGRRIFDNIRKFIRYTMTSNMGEILTLFMAPLLGLPLPLIPIQILWINLITDGLPGLALSAEPAERGIMSRPPRPPGEAILANGMGFQILWIGGLIGLLTLGTQAWALSMGNPHWQTMLFTVLTFSQLFNAWAIRSSRESIFQRGFISNPMMVGAIVLTFLLQLMVIYTPFFQTIFKTDPLSANELGFCLLISTVVIPAIEIEKWLVRKGVIGERL